MDSWVISVAFILGFSIVFITLGALSTEVGQLASQYKSTLARVAGVVTEPAGVASGLTDFEIRASFTCR